MPRATSVRSAADREFHTHLERATAAVRAALDVCGRVARNQRRGIVSEDFQSRMERLARARHLLGSVGHLKGQGGLDLKDEARALCSWLEGRERLSRTPHPPRRGREYQERLHQVLRFLGGEDMPAEVVDSTEVPPVEVSPEDPLSDGILWGRALNLARQQGMEDDDAYVQSIFRRLAGGVSSG